MNVFFFFKQKTAYEMRISDWSSDVCSSDLFGGRIAEELFMNQMTTGASNDFERATAIARDIVTRYGMTSELGPMVYAENEGEVFLGRSVTKTTHMSEATMQKDRKSTLLNSSH